MQPKNIFSELEKLIICYQHELCWQQYITEDFKDIQSGLNWKTMKWFFFSVATASVTGK